MHDHRHLKRFRRGRTNHAAGDENSAMSNLKMGCARLSILVCVLSSLFYFSDGGIACLSNPCLYGLCVDDVNSSYSCFCTDGYTGQNCQTEWNECWSQPCLNGGDCFDLIAAYNCSCAEGFSGLACEIDRDECISQPCQNNGTCVDGSNGFRCNCLPGYTGSVCEWDISVCNETGTERCLNGGACVEGPGERFWCICAPGWGGAICEEPLDPCLIQQPCLHGGLCLPRDTDFICACPFGFTGDRCEFELSMCKENPCWNGAICIEEGNSSTCYCVPDFHGDLCQFQYDECLLPPTPSCKNGGSCIDGVDGFTCSCPPDVTGRYCECPIGQDCTNHTYHPSLPTTESQNEISSTFHSKGSSTLFTSYLPRSSTSLSTISSVSAVTHLSTHFHGENKGSGEDDDGKVTHLTISPNDGISSAESTIVTKDFNVTDSSDFYEGETSVSTEKTDKFPPELMPTFSPPLTSTVTGKLPTSPISSTIVTDDYSSATEPSINDTFTTDRYGTSDPRSSSALVSSTKSSSSASTVVMRDGFSTMKGSNADGGGDQSYSSTIYDSSTMQSTATEETEAEDVEGKDSKLQKSTALPIESATPTYSTMMTFERNTTYSSSPFSELLSTFSTTSSQSDFTDGEDDDDGGSSTSFTKVPFVPKLDDLNSTSTRMVDLTEQTKSFQTSSNYSDKTLVPTQSFTTDEYDYEESIMPDYNLTSSESSLVTKPHTLTPPEVYTSTVTAAKNTSVTSTGQTDDRSTISIFDSTKITSTTQDKESTLNQSSSTYAPVVVVSTLVTAKASVGTESSATGSFTTPIGSKTSQILPVDADYSTSEGHFDEDESKDIPRSTTEDRFPDYGTATPDYVDTTVAEPKRCSGTESPCLNGGVCFTLESETVCRCPFQFTGKFCENPTNYSEVSLLPTSWILFRIATALNDTEQPGFTHSLEATFRIVSEEGIVFTLAEADDGPTSNYYMQMSIYRGRLQLLFSCGLQSVKFSESKQRIDTGQPTRISARLSMWMENKTSNLGRCKAELKLNDTLAVSGEQSRPIFNSNKDVALAHLVFGAWPRSEFQKSAEEEDIFSEKISTSPGVVACLSGVKVNSKAKVLLADVTAGSNDVSECVQLACLSNPCLFGGTCDESPTNSWSCRCPSGRLGPRCEISVCENNPCQAGGTCLVHPGTNFVCLCPLGREGIFCEKEHQITKPCFFPTFVDINPFLALPLMPRHESFRHTVEARLKFTPLRTHQVALLAYIGHGPKDHMALGYVHGRIILTWDLGSGPRRIFTNKEFLAGVEQDVTFGRSGKEGWLKVKGDNMTHSGQSIGKMTQLNTRPIVFFGGFDDGNTSILPHDLPKHSGFEGCLSHIEIKTASSQTSKFYPPGPPSSPAKGRSVFQQDFNVCASNPCRQKGICLPHGPSFTCLCAQGWFGPLCAEPRNPCDTHRNMCAEGSTCVPLHVGYECDCPLGKTGRFCNSVEGRSSVVWPELYFSGKRSFLEVPRSVPLYSDPGQLEHSCVEFEIKPQAWKGAPAAQVLFFSQDPDTGDFMTLLLTADRVLELILGSRDDAPTILSSPRGVSIRASVWVRIRAGRVGRRVFLSVGGRSVSSWLLPGQSTNWNGGHSTLYIGGAPDLSSVAPVTWLLIRPFGGCIRKLHVDWRKVIVHLGRARLNNREVRNIAKQPHKFRYDVAQLAPEYIRQVKVNGNGFIPFLADEIVSLLRGEILASYVSATSDGLLEGNNKKSPDFHSLGKNDPSWSLNFRRGKEFKILSLVNSKNSTEAPPEEMNELESSTAEPETTLSVDKITPPGVMTKNLRTRDALFALSARNVKPCDKSALALLQLDPCIDGQAELDCLSQPLKDQNSTQYIPGFKGNGWIMIRSPLLSADRTEHSPISYLNIRFSTKSSKGLLVWIQQDTDNEAFVGLGLVDGRLRVVWGSNSNTSNTAIVSGLVNDGLFHRVTVLWNVGERAVIWMDGEVGEVETEWKRQKRHFSTQVVSTLTIAVGGYPKDHLVSDLMLRYFDSSLSGCIAELAWNDESAQLSDFSSYHHENVFSCSAVL